MVKNVVIIQARLGSSRLPGKVLLELKGRPVLAWSVEAARQIVGVSNVAVATTDQPSDDAIFNWCAENDVTCYRGPEDDVLRRYAISAEGEDADNILRITSDCPFVDPHVCGQVLAMHLSTAADFTTNNDPPSWPDGLDCEAMTRDALMTADKEATRPSDREHVATFIRNSRHKFKVQDLVCPIPDLFNERWTLDTPEDWAFFQEIAKHLNTDTPSVLDVFSIVREHPEIRELNASQQRDAGLAKSVAQNPTDLDRDYARSNELLERAQKVIPLGSQTFSKSWQQYPKSAAPMFLTHGQGARVWDVDGNEYIDMVSGLLPIVLGYRDPDVDHAVKHQLSQGISFSLSTELEIQLAEELIDMIPCAEAVRFGKNGTDATSAAVRIARAKTGRDRIAVGGYHGWQDWYVGITTRNKGIPDAVCDLTHSFPFNDLDALEQLLNTHKDEFAAVIIEPAGANIPNEGYLKAVQELAHKHGTLLVFDEVVTGFRWAAGGAQEYYGVTPDLASFGKALGNGMPIAAIVGAADIMKEMEDVFLSSTFGGETLSIAASLAVLDKIRTQPVIEHVWNVGGIIAAHVRKAIKDNGLGDYMSLIGADPWTILAYKDAGETKKEAIKTLFVREMLKAGVLINASNNVSYSFSQDDVSKVLGAYDYALSYVAESIKSNDTAKQIGNQIIEPVFSIRST
ncbi:aminotransferase class III-fold pyridoxal phosphate-dependent enzyme [Magnetovibrio sp. PR-2]|uniref:aminotransferase class III-fold pyridoxal phosphate-dependent enzyme n=1 Tax=Magnetovibrio sp. PR-2 TaxID=3120356 RepID=UPI002FCDFF9E